MKLKNKILKISLVASLLATSANAIDLDGALYMALFKNNDLKLQNLETQESKQNLKLNDANFLPKLDLSHSYNNRDEVNTGSPEEDATLGAKLSYNIFNGLKDKANKDSSEFLYKASKANEKAKRLDVMLDIKKAYINTLNKVNELETYQSEYELFHSQYTDAKNRYDQGLMARNDLLQVEVNMANAKQNIVRAKADVKIAKLQLSNYLGGFDLSNETIKPLKEKDLHIFDTDEKLLENRSEIKSLKMNLESLKNQKKAAKSSYYPKVDAALAHNRYYEDLSFNEIETGIDNQNILSLNSSWNLYNGGSDEQRQKIYNIQMLKTKVQLQKTMLDIKLQYENAKSDLAVATENYATAKLSLEQAKENYKIVKNRFKEGISTSTDLTDANFLLTSAKQKYNKAYFDKFISVATLRRVLGRD